MAKSSPTPRIRLTALFKEFYQSQQSAGILLIVCTLLSLYWANSSWGETYRSFWHFELGSEPFGLHLKHSLGEWINDALMTVFFLLVGLEIERELYIGELSNRKQALLPVIAAVGGMAVPALIYMLSNWQSPETLRGIGIPTATDIAFAIALMSLLGDRVPPSLKVFLTALAIIDDLGAIFVIALFYGDGFHWAWLGASILIGALMFVFQRRGVTSLWVYLPLGLLLWLAMMHSGIHATLAGVILAFAIPFEDGKPHTVSYKLEHRLAAPVTFFILPLFALANTAIPISSDTFQHFLGPESMGIFLGLVLGKPLGIVTFSLISVKLGYAHLSANISRRMLWGAGMLGGIGFTMAMFVTNLAFNDQALIDLGKLSVLVASTTAALLGYSLLRWG
ncbi:MAG: Na+/H+ antiporter NhaA, partial [Bacteroidia bacterium]